MRNSKLHCVILTALSLLASIGCAPALIPMDKAEMDRLKGEPQIYVVVYQPARFFYQIVGDAFAIGGPTDGLAQESRAARFVRTYSLADPVVKAKEAFIAGLAGQIEAGRLIQIQDILSDDSVENLRKRFGHGVVLDFKTEIWGLLPAPLSLLYQTPYAVRAKLVRLTDGQVLWRGYCHHRGSDFRATWEEFTANSATLLKKKLSETAEACGKELVSQFLGK